MNHPADVMSRLMHLIEDRKSRLPDRSYTTSLFQEGLPRIGAKVLEEAREVVEAAAEPGEAGRSHTIHEAADVVFHLLVLLAQRDCTWEQVEAELGRRFGISGLDEKAARTPAGSPPEKPGEGTDDE